VVEVVCLNRQIHELARADRPCIRHRFTRRDVLNEEWFPSWNTLVAVAVSATTNASADSSLAITDVGAITSDQ